ncbi:MAG TPA: BON domain-containing protein [Bdellovibrionota bacterium]|nr:BON domain-containing protein [Bdellovibrionota bacterium]
MKIPVFIFVASLFSLSVHATDHLSELRELIKDMPGITTRIIGSRFVIEGETQSLKDYARIQKIISDKVYQDVALNLSSLSDAWLEKKAKEIQADISVFAEGVTARVSNHHIILEGSVQNMEQANRAVMVSSIELPNDWPEYNRKIDDADTKSRLLVNFLIVAPPPKKR